MVQGLDETGVTSGKTIKVNVATCPYEGECTDNNVKCSTCVHNPKRSYYQPVWPHYEPYWPTYPAYPTWPWYLDPYYPQWTVTSSTGDSDKIRSYYSTS